MKKQFHVQYIVTLLVTLLALALIVYYTFGSFYSIARKDAITIGQNTVSEEAEKVNNFLLKGLDVMQVTGLVVDYMMQHGSSSKEIEKFLLEESKRYEESIDKNFTGIYGVFDDVYIDGIGWVPDEDYVPQERPWYTTAVEAKGRPAIVSPYLDAQTNTVMISVSQLLSDGESVVSLDIVMEEVQEMAKDIKLNGFGYGMVMDDTGLVVAHSDESQKGKNYLEDDSVKGTQQEEMVRRVYQSGGEAFEMELNGTKSMVFSRIVQQDWYVVMVIDESDLFRKVQDNLIRNILISLIIFGVVAYFCTSSYRNRRKAMHLVDELQEYQLTLEDRVREKTKENEAQNVKLMQMQQNVIDGMATVIESRDGNTGLHVKNVKCYVSMMVAYMKEQNMYPEEIDETFVRHISSAAVLHDIGKIKISDQILNKPGRFQPEEFAIMKTHSQLGGDIVEEILGKDADPDLLQLSKDITTYHHEKWDGTGYPAGLKETQIPLSARIMAVADVFDALVSKRVYKEKMSKEKAYDILREDAGSHFDPDIIEVFFAIQDQVEAYLQSVENSAQAEPKA